MPDPTRLPPLEARPAEGFRRTDNRGLPTAQPLARRRDFRRCEGVWVLPVRVRPGLLLEADKGWSALARNLGTGRQQGDVAECPLQFDSSDWPPDTQALVLMLWPQVCQAFRARATPADLQTEVAAAAEVAATLARTAAARGNNGLATGLVTGPATEPMPETVLQAISDALAHQSRPGGSLAGSVLPGPAGSLAPVGADQAGTPAAAKSEIGPAAASAAAAVAVAAPAPLLRFHLAACLYPGGLFERSARPHPGSLDDPSQSNLPGPADRSLQRLRKLREGCGFTTPVLLAGDQIYVDATAGLFDPTLRDEPYKRAYDRLRELDWRTEALMGCTPVTLMDDHEVANNWEPSLHRGRAADGLTVLFKGRYAFLQRQRQINPDPIDGPRSRRWLWRKDDSTLPGHLLFVGDTRSERSARDPKCMLDARIMGEDQRKALLWALYSQQAQHPGQLKFIATSSMLLPRRLSTAQAEQAHAEAWRPGQADRPYHHAGALRSDAWCGYPGSLHDLLASLVDLKIQHCVFLSGDEHIGCVAEATVQQTTPDGQAVGQPIKLWSVHTGALYAPYPFANGLAEDFAEQETFSFEIDSCHYRCQVAAWFPSRNENKVRDKRFVRAREAPPFVGDGFVEVVVGTAPDHAGCETLSLVFRHGQDELRDAAWPPPAG